MAVYNMQISLKDSWRRSTKGNWYLMNLLSLIPELSS